MGNARKPSSDMLPGTLELLILTTLAWRPMHGWGIAQRIERVSEAALRVEQGSLYPALHRLERAGAIAAEWRASENNRRAKYYRLTPTGRRRLATEEKDWARASGAIAKILAAARG